MKRVSLTELREKYRAKSAVSVAFGTTNAEQNTDGTYAPEIVTIRFSGPIARIPSLKNSHPPAALMKSKAIFTAPQVLARLVVMTELFNNAMRNAPRIDYGDRELWCVVILGKRPTAFDEDNGFAAVKDWLEPRIKAGRDRRWGVGLVRNDRQVGGFAIHSRKTGIEVPESTIYLMPFECVRSSVLEHVAKVQLG